MAVFVRKDSCAGANFQNIATLKSPGQPDQPMSLRELRDCGPIMFKDNQVVPAPNTDLIPGSVGKFPTSKHGFDENDDGLNYPNDGVPYYNHEFGGFSKKLTRETPKPLSPGNYTIKIVVQDVFDRSVDSAVFLESGSLKLFPLTQGDYNGDGCVDVADFYVWAAHYGQSPATFYDGDGNSNCAADIADYFLWRDNLGAGGNGDFRADFNRDGIVNGTDYFIWLENAGLLECASRFEGDANGDGAVKQDDLVPLQALIWG